MYICIHVCLYAGYAGRYVSIYVYMYAYMLVTLKGMYVLNTLRHDNNNTYTHIHRYTQIYVYVHVNCYDMHAALKVKNILTHAIHTHIHTQMCL
jgi:hypothetical protein